jgi:hypothetical protein
MEDHPGRAEPVSEHRKTEREKRFLHWHENLTASGKQSVNALRLVYAVNSEGKIRAANGLKTIRRNVRSEKFRLSDVDAGVEDGFFQSGETLSAFGC